MSRFWPRFEAREIVELDMGRAGHVQCRMTCPVCHETMRSVMFGLHEVLHCANCGTSFFEDNGINRIDIVKARELAQERYNKGLTPGQKVTCPRDETVLKVVSGTEAVPRTVRLYACPECLGILVSADDLEAFKRAQLSKLDYFKAWNLPLGSVRGVLAIGLIVVLSGTLYYTYNTITREATIRSEASELIKNIHTTTSGRYIFVSFSTKIPVKSWILIENQTKGQTVIQPVSQELKKLHTVTLTQPSEGEQTVYRVRLVDGAGRTVDTQEIKLK